MSPAEATEIVRGYSTLIDSPTVGPIFRQGLLAGLWCAAMSHDIDQLRLAVETLQEIDNAALRAHVERALGVTS